MAQREVHAANSCSCLCCCCCCDCCWQDHCLSGQIAMTPRRQQQSEQQQHKQRRRRRCSFWRRCLFACHSVRACARVCECAKSAKKLSESWRTSSEGEGEMPSDNNVWRLENTWNHSHTHTHAYRETQREHTQHEQPPTPSASARQQRRRQRSHPCPMPAERTGGAAKEDWMANWCKLPLTQAKITNGIGFCWFSTHAQPTTATLAAAARERRTYKPSPFGQSQINFKRTNRANTTTTTTTLRKKSRKTNTRQKQQKKKAQRATDSDSDRAAQRSRASADCDKCVYDRKGVLTNQSSSFAHSLGPGPHFVQRESAPALFHSNSPQYTHTQYTSIACTRTQRQWRARSTQFAGAELCVV